MGKYSAEYIVSSDDLQLGFRGLWNFGSEEKRPDSIDPIPPRTFENDDVLSPPINGRLSAGLEMYYGLLNKGGGRNDPSVSY